MIKRERVTVQAWQALLNRKRGRSYSCSQCQEIPLIRLCTHWQPILSDCDPVCNPMHTWQLTMFKTCPCRNCIHTTAAYLVHIMSHFATIQKTHTRDSVSSSHFVPVFRCIRIWRPLPLTVYATFQLYTYVTACLLYNRTQCYFQWH